MERVYDRGALVKALDKQWLDLTSTIGKGILAFLSALAQDERERIIKRSNDGRKAARERGVRFGRKPKLTVHQKGEAFKMLASGARLQEVADMFGIHKSNVSRLR